MKTTNVGALLARIMLGTPNYRIKTNLNQPVYDPQVGHSANGGRPMFKQNRRAQMK
jgi:hypothetical protein